MFIHLARPGFSCSMRDLWSSLRLTGFLVTAHGLSYSAACGVFPDQGLSPSPLHWEVDSTTGPLVVQLLSHVRLFATLWTAAHQASLSITNSSGLQKLMSIESVMPPNHLILCCSLLLLLSIFPTNGNFSNEKCHFFTSGGQSTGISASVSDLPMSIQDWFLLGITGWISLQSKELSRVFSNTTVQKHKFFSIQVFL